MDKDKLLEILKDIEDTLTDAYNTGHEGEINSDSLYFIDQAKGSVEDLIIKHQRN